MTDMSTTNKFIEFVQDDEAMDMYITGAAGTGKTTDLSYSVTYCIDNDIPYVVCAYTHKACGILRSKLPSNALVMTLHSLLKKRPTINTDATSTSHINQNIRLGDLEEPPRVMFLDEYSFVGERDYTDIRDSQEQEGKPPMKVVWLGDPHQLPPVGDQPAVIPEGDYQVVLTKQYRNDNPLQGPLTKLIGMMSGAAPEPLLSVPGYFERNLDIVDSYMNCTEDKVILAFTNERVQWLNQAIAGKDLPDEGEELFSPNTHKHYKFVRWVPPEYVTHIDIHFSDGPLILGSKYKTLENLIDTGLCDFAEVIDDFGDTKIFATVYGHYDYKVTKEKLEREAVSLNREIEQQYPDVKAAQWARMNNTSPLAKKRAKAWRDCLSFKDCVICLDFSYAVTVHKSQGSTYHSVFVDTNDLYKCAQRNFPMYLRLMYVAISRASKYVGTN